MMTRDSFSGGEVNSLVVENELWSRATEHYQEGQFEQAAIIFRKIVGKAKAHYNVGVCYLALLDCESAIVAFTESVRLDSFLAVGWYQLAFLFHKRGDLKESLKCYYCCIKSFRENGVIDYNQIGMDYRLFITEALVNVASVQMDLCMVGEATRSLVLAHEHRCKAEHGVIDLILLNPTTEWQLFKPPTTLIFTTSTTIPLLRSGELELSGKNPEAEREIIQSCESPVDCSLAFAAPLLKERLEEELEQIFLLTEPAGRGDNSSGIITSTASFEDMDLLAKLWVIEQATDCVLQTRIIKLDDCPTMTSLREKIKKKCELKGFFRIKYSDRDGDYITICDDEDLQLAIQESMRTRPTFRIKLVLHCFLEPLMQNSNHLPASPGH